MLMKTVSERLSSRDRLIADMRGIGLRGLWPSRRYIMLS